MMQRRRRIAVPILILLPIVLFLVTICVGRYSISAEEVFRSIAQAITGANYGVSFETYTVAVNIRIPRAIHAIMVGAALSVSGAAFQSIFRNPLVSGGILGVSGGAGFGAALSILMFGSYFLTPAFSFTFGVIAVVLSFFVGKIGNTSPTVTLVLGGTIIQNIFSAMLSLLKYMADTESELPAITFWLMGSLASTKDADIIYAGIPMLAGILGMVLLRYRLNVLSMGDREARTLGINVTANKVAVIGFATMATAGAVCVSGTIGFVGLVIPHIGRMILGNDNRVLIPACISIGACFLLIVDTLCRTVTGGELPLGIVTSIVGGPYFIYLLKRTKGRNW